MKVLIISNSSQEGLSCSGKGTDFFKELTDNICSCKEHQAKLLDISSVDPLKVALSEIEEILEENGVAPLDFDIIHTFSVLPFIFKETFPVLTVYSFDSQALDEVLKKYVKSTDNVGYAAYEMHNTDADIICEAYLEFYNNRRNFDKRPWGWWRSLVLLDDYKVKQIYVAPGGKLSLQTHKFRSEIWTIAHGSGFITLDDKILPAEKGDVFKIERGQIHRAEGGENGLYIIELQVGDYLGEDDIIRLEDIYGRK